MEEVVCDTKSAGIARSIMHRGQSWPMYVSPSEFKILKYLLIPEKKLLVTWSYLQNFFGECWTLPYMTHLLVYFHYLIEVSTTSFSLRKTALKQPELVKAEYGMHRKEFLPCPPRKHRKWIEEIGLFKATKLRVARFEGERPFLTKNRVWAWSEPKQPNQKLQFFIFLLLGDHYFCFLRCLRLLRLPLCKRYFLSGVPA